jgi:hypothetical protein
VPNAPQTASPPSANAERSPEERQAPRECLNCGRSVTGNFCAECGQRAIDPNPTLRELVHELAEGFLNWDGKLLGTLRLLVTSPGALTREYLAGRRVRFISPLRVYLTCSVLFFFMKAVLPNAPMLIRSTTSGSSGKATSSTTNGGVISVQADGDSLSDRALDSLAARGSGVTQLWWRHFASALRNKRALSEAVTSNVPRMMFVLVPIFAGMVALVFRSRRMRYPQHLAFALHVHAFLFLALILTLAPRIVTIGWVNAVLVAGSFTAIGAHLVLAMRRVYAVSTGGAIARSALIAAAYFVIFMLTFALLFVGAVLLV